MAEGLEVGTAYLQLTASGRGLQKQTDAEIRKVKAADIEAEITANIAALEKKADQARKKLEQLRAVQADPQIDLDIAAAQAKAALVEAKLKDLRGQKASAQVTADITAAEAQLGRLNASIQRLESKRSGPKITADIAAAERNLAGIESQVRRLEGARASVRLGVDGAAGALAQIQGVDRARGRLDGSRASLSIAASGGAQASGMLGAVVAGLAAVTALAPAAGAALSGALAAASGGAQVAGTIAAGFSGIGDAIKAVEADEKSAATSSAGAAKSRTSSAGQIASAQSSLAQAVMQADRAAVTGGQQVAQARLAAARTQVQGGEQVADAALAVGRAQQQADRTAISSGQQVAASRRAVADAVVAASERTGDAERSVARAQQSSRYAQEALTQAREDAIEANEDLQLSLSGVAVSERRAELALRKALAARASGGDVDPEMFKGEELDLDVDEAVQNLREVRERYGDLRAQQAAWVRGGVNGSAQVVAAQRAAADATLGVQDAQRSLVRTSRDGARSIADAVEQSSQAQQQAAWANQDAQASVADAQRASGRAARDAAWANQDAASQVAQAVQQAGWAQQDAARGVSEAQRGLQQALAATAESAGGAGAAGKQSAYELSKLTPAGRSFVDFVTGEWQPAIKGVSDSVAGELLPRVERAGRTLLGLMPELQRCLSGTGVVIGDLAVRGSDLATSPAFRASFGQIMDSNNRALGSWGQAALYGADSARVLTVAGLPLSEQLARGAAAAVQSADSFLLQKQSTGELAAAMEFGAGKVGQLVDVAIELAKTGYQVGVALAPVGEIVIDVATGMIKFVGEFAEAHPVLIQFAAGAGIAVAATNSLAKGIVAVQGSAAIAGGGLKTLWTVMSTGLNPVALANTQALRGFQTAMAQAAPAVSTFATGGLPQLTKAGNVAAGATRALGSAVRYGAAALPLLGVAITGIVVAGDALNTSFDEGVELMGKGGAAAAKLRAELAANSAERDSDTIGLHAWLREHVAGAETTESFSAKLAEQRNQWSNLENAQYDAGIAQGNYDQALRQFGPTSKQATDALANLNVKTRDVEIAQIAVREKTDLATAAMLWQRDQILASLDADLRLRMSKQQLAKDQQGLADAIRSNGPASQQAIDAGYQLEQTQLRTADAARSSAGGQRAYVDAIKDMVARSNGEFTPSLAKMVASLDQAGLAAVGASVKLNDTGQAVVTMPGGKTITVDVQNAPALNGLAGVTYQLSTVPPGKTITVQTLDADAQNRLRALGFTVTTLPNGQVTVTANDAAARGTLQAFQAFAAWQQANPQLAADPAKAYGAMQGFLRDAGASTGVPMLDADPRRADQTVHAKLDEFNRWNARPTLDLDTSPAQQKFGDFWGWLIDQATSNLPFGLGRGAGGPIPGRADGGLIGYASGGRISHRQVFTGMEGGGRVRGPGGPTADRVPIMGSAGEYMVRASAVRAVGVPALDAINGMRHGGYIGHVLGYAAGGQVQQPAAAPTGGPGTVAVPTGDADAAAGASSATAELAGAMGMAAGAAGVLAPGLAAVTAEQQAMVASGVSPLAAALTGGLVPAVAAGNAAVGVQAPLALQALQGAQAATQVSTGLTAQNAAINNAAVAGSTAAMSQQAQLEHAGLRAGQVATQLATGQTAAVTAAENAGMVATTTGMSLAAQGQHAGLRAGHVATQLSAGQTALVTAGTNADMANTTTGMSFAAQGQHAGLRGGHLLTQQSAGQTAGVMAGTNQDMVNTTGGMSFQNQGHLTNLRGAQGVTVGSTVGFADAWRDQLGRTVPDSANPLRHVINVPIGGIVNAWNTIDAQFALGKHVNPPVAGFATGGVMPGYTPGRDTMTIGVSGGEAIMRPEWTRAVGTDYIDAGNAAARRGGVGGVQTFLSGRAMQQAMAHADLDDSPQAARSNRHWAGGFAYGGVAPHVAFAGDTVTRALGPMPGGIGGRGARGNTSDHPFGFALDFMTMANSGLGDRVAGFLQNQAEPLRVKYLIWKQAINGGRGWSPMENRGSATANHFDHVHASFEGGPLGGMWGDGAGGGGSVFDFGSIIRDAFKFVYDQVAEVPRIFGPSDQVARGAGVPRAGADMAIDSLVTKLGAMFASSGGGGNAAAYRPQIAQALGMLGLPQAWAGSTERRANKESGGNPSAVNRWDSNARAGHPSVGLMQVIRGTYAAYKDPRRDVGPYLFGVSVDPLSNLLASMRYGMARYHSLPAAYDRPGGYDNGGLLPHGGVGVNTSGGDEWVLDNVETRSYDTLTRLVGQNGAHLELGDFEPRGETHNHFLENGVIRETVDIDQVMRRAEFMAGSASL